MTTTIVISAVIIFIVFLFITFVLEVPALVLFTCILCIVGITAIIAALVLLNTTSSDTEFEMIKLLQNLLIIGMVTVSGIVLSVVAE